MVGEDATQIVPGQTIPLDPSMKVICLSAGRAVIGEQNVSLGSDENDRSVSLLITFGSFRYFVGGDIHELVELKIAAADLAPNVDVYQANHHGSHTSSSFTFLEDLSPSVVIISNGNVARYQHPRQVTLDNFERLQPAPVVFQTNKYLDDGDEAGNVLNAFIADPETHDKDGTILVTVNPSATSYRVTYGTDSSHTFLVKAATIAGDVIIESLLPNPAGLDSELEEVTLRNTGTDAISVVDWVLKDASGKSWSLNAIGSIAPNASATIVRNGQPMSLNNSGDEIVLIDDQDRVRDRFVYLGSTEGERITTGN